MQISGWNNRLRLLLQNLLILTNWRRRNLSPIQLLARQFQIEQLYLNPRQTAFLRDPPDGLNRMFKVIT